MENKVLVKLFIPDLDTSFDLFLPVNELVWKIKKLIIKSVADLKNIPLNIDDEVILLNKDTSKIYSNNDILIETDIRNGTELILIFKSE